MKTLTLLAAAVASSLFLTPHAQARPVGKIAGKYSGSGVFTDKRTATTSTYQYTFDPLKVNVSSSENFRVQHITIAIALPGGAFIPIATSSVTVKGNVTAIQENGSKLRRR